MDYLNCKKLFCFQNDHLQSSIPHDTATVAIGTLPREPTEQTVYKVELKVIAPVIVGIIVLLMIILCIRYRLEQSTWFQSLLSTLNGTRAKHRPHFDPPPEYEVALKMPKPVANHTTRESVHIASDSNGFPDEPSSTCLQDIEKQTGERNAKSPSVAETCQMTIVNEQGTTENNLILPTASEHCGQGTKIPMETMSNDNTEQIFTISTVRHLHKMTYNSTSPPQYLPSYEEYIEQLPSGHL